MKKLHTLAILASLGLASISSFSSAFAASRANTMTFSAGGGYYYFAQKRSIDNTALPFIGLGYNITDRWGIEGILATMSTKSHSPEDDGSHVNGTLFLLDGLYHFPVYRDVVEPYVILGVGGLGLDPNGTDARNEGNINAGLGLNLWADKVVGFRFEARDIYTIVGGKNDVMLDAGVTFLLDLC